jgi:hypothetical protein
MKIQKLIAGMVIAGALSAGTAVASTENGVALEDSGGKRIAPSHLLLVAAAVPGIGPSLAIHGLIWNYFQAD